MNLLSEVSLIEWSFCQRSVLYNGVSVRGQSYRMQYSARGQSYRMQYSVKGQSYRMKLLSEVSLIE